MLSPNGSLLLNHSISNFIKNNKQIISKNKKSINIFLFLSFLLSFCFNVISQVTIVSDGLNNSSTIFTLSGGLFYTGNSAAGDRVASSPFAVEGTHSYGKANGTATLTSSNINTSSYNTIELSLRIASFSISTNGNGADAGDNIKIEVSPNGGTNYYPTIQLNGNANACWSYTGGTGIASTPYDGDITAITFAPAGGATRTTDGYSTINITSLPSVSNLRVRITLLNDHANELWVVDDFKVTGILSVPSPEINLQTASTNRACGYTHSFGNVLTTSSGSVNLTIQNTGTLPLNISGLNLTGSSDYSIVSPPSTPFAIAAGSSQVIAVNFNPTVGGTINGTLTILSDDSDEGSCDFNLTGVGVIPSPEINLQTSATNRACGYTHSFGSILTGSSGTVNLTIQNIGTSVLNISGLNLTGSSDYSLSPPPATPFTIAAGSSQVITINFNPTVGGTIISVLTILSDDSDESSCQFNLSGVGVNITPCSELLFSEYIEGSSNNKYLEIYNPSNSTINLSNYEVRLYANGASTPTNTQTFTTQTIAPYSTFVLKNSSATIYGGPAMVSTTTGFNGDDAIALFNITGAYFTDIIGTIGEDPGTAWSSGAHSTLDKTLVRKLSVNKGVLINPTSGFPTLTTEWNVFSIDDVSNLGSHASNCVSFTVSNITGSPYSISCSSSAAGTIDYNFTGTFVAGNIITAQLSDASGSFSSPINIGTLNSTANTGTINITIPAGTAGGSSYRIRVISSNPAMNSTDNGTDITITNIPCSINTGTVNSSPFTVDCSTSSSGTVDFTSIGTYTAGNIYTVQLSNTTGSFASPTTIGTLTSSLNSGTINISIPAGTIGGNAYRIRVISSNPSIIGSDNGTDLTIVLNTCSITTGTVTGTPFSVDCNLALTDVGTVDFTSIGNFIAGNVYTAQLSNSSGSFAYPILIGSITSVANSGTINITIPSSTSSGIGYRIRVVSSNPSLIGTNNGTDITINQISPCLPSIPSAGLLINEFSNGASGEKEYYEFVVAGKCGETVDIRGFIIDDNNGTFSTVFPSTSGIAEGHLKLSNHAQWQTMPVGSLILIYNNDDKNPMIPGIDDPFDSNSDSLYIIPHNHPTLFNITSEIPSNSIPDSTYSPIVSYVSSSWGPLSLRNAGDAVQIRTPNGNYFHGVSYGGSEINGGPNNMKLLNSSMTGMCGWFNDGDIYNISNWSTGVVSGNETPGLPNNAANLAWLRLMRDPNSATCPIVVLPSTTIDFKGKYEQGKSMLEWQTISEQNNSYFTISHTTDGKKFNPIGTINGAGNSSELLNYRFTHPFPHPGMNYYKLVSTDYDGTNYDKGIVAIKAEFSFSFYNSQSSTIELFYDSDIEIYSTDGKLIKKAMDTKSIPFNKSGFFFIFDKRSGITERLFVP